jgi:type II secretory pathway component PulK
LPCLDFLSLDELQFVPELKQVEGIEYKDYLKIKPYLTASSLIKTINIISQNTFSPYFKAIKVINSLASVNNIF